MTEHTEKLSATGELIASRVRTGSVRVSSAVRWGLAGLGVLVALLVWNRASHSAKLPDKPARDVPYLDGKWIRYSQGFATRSGLAFGTVAQGQLSPIVHVTGTVTFDPDRVADIGARIAGRVRSVRRLEGDQVQRGDVLAEIESAELGQAQASLISARAHAAAATANEKRERELAEAKISSNREAEMAAAAAAAARAELLAAQSRVHAMGGREAGEPGVLLLQSPLAGKIVARNLSRGQFVEPTLTAFRVADLSRVFIALAVYERDVATIRSGDSVEIAAVSGSAATVRGSVSYAGDEIDLETKTAAVRVIVDQPDTPLRPGQSVLAKIQTSARAQPSLVLSRDAVTSVDGKSTVFVAQGELAVEPRSVKLGRQDASQVEVVEGLRVGERVVVSGVFELKSEIFR
jgi:cobalt-zinc-cadmium efflux system membrane fusion protein